MLNVNAPMLDVQMMTENPFTVVGIFALAFIALGFAYIGYVAYKEHKQEKAQSKLNAMENHVELEAFGLPTAEETQQRAYKAC